MGDELTSGNQPLILPDVGNSFMLASLSNRRNDKVKQASIPVFLPGPD